MKRKFFTNLVLLLTINVLVKPFWLFGIDRAVQVATGDLYGFYGELLALSITFNTLLDLGITNYNNRNIARHNHLLTKYLGNILGLKLILAFIYAFVCIAFGLFSGFNSAQFHLLYFLIFNQFLLQFILYLRSNLSALHLFTLDSVASVLDRVFVILFCGILLFTNVAGGVFKIEWFVYVQTLSYVLATLIIFLIVLKKSGRVKISFNYNFSRVYLKKTFPYAILILLMAFYNRFDTVLMGRLLPIEEANHQVGLYMQGFRFLDAVSMFGVLFAGMLLPIFARMIKLKQPVGEMVSFSFSLILFISLTVAVASWFYQADIIALMGFPHVEKSAPIFAILMFCFIPISVTYIFGTLLTANGSIKMLNIMAACGMVINISLNLIVIPELGAYGSAWVSLLTQSATALAQVVIASLVFHFKIKWKLVLQVLTFACFVIVVGYFSRYVGNRLLGFTLVVTSSTLAAFVVRLINLKVLINIVQNKE